MAMLKGVTALWLSILMCFFYVNPLPSAYALPDSVLTDRTQETLTQTLSEAESRSASSKTQNLIPSGAAIQEPPTLSSATSDSASSTLSLETRTFEVDEGESIQAAINQAQAGDTIFVHAGTYHEHLVLTAGVNLKGEGETTIIHGDGLSQDIITALGNNIIENLTITGGGPYAGVPSSAIRVQSANVIIRNNILIDNRNYVVYIDWSVGNGAVTIEGNRFQQNHIGVQLPKDGTVIRDNEFIQNDIGVNVLMGARPLIEGNLFQESTFGSIYEYPRGNAVVRNNTFIANMEHGTYYGGYGSALPLAAANQTDGNRILNPSVRLRNVHPITISIPIRIRDYSDGNYEVVYGGQIQRSLDFPDGTICFQLGDRFYKAYRDASGNVKLEDETQLIRAMPLLKKYYGDSGVPANIRAEINPRNPSEINVFISEMQNGMLVDVRKIVIMTYGGQYNVSQVVDLKTHTQAQFNYEVGYVLSSIWRTTCDDIHCMGGYWRSQIQNIILDPVNGRNTADIVSVVPPLWSDSTPVIFPNFASLLTLATDMDIPAPVVAMLFSVKNAMGSLTFHFSYFKTGYKVVLANPSAAVGGLSRMEFVVARDGSISTTGLQVTYQGASGDLKPDGKLLFGALHQAPISANDPQALVHMANLILDSIDLPIDVDAHHSTQFKLDGKYYRAYWNNTVAMLIAIPDLVGKTYDGLQVLGSEYVIKMVFTSAARIDVYIHDYDYYHDTAAAGRLEYLQIFFDGNGGTLGIYAQYANYGWVSGDELFDALHQLPTAPGSNPDVQALVNMGKLTALQNEVPDHDAKLDLTFELDRKFYRAYSDVNWIPGPFSQNNGPTLYEIPAVIWNYAVQLKQQFGNGFSVTAIPQTGGTWSLEVVDKTNPSHRLIQITSKDAAGVTLWTQQYYYTGANTTPDYSKRTYAGGDIDYYNAAGQRFVDALLDRTHIDEQAFNGIVGSSMYIGRFDPLNYQQFLGYVPTVDQLNVLKNAISMGMSVDAARFVHLLNAAQHILFMPSSACASGTGICPSFAMEGTMVTSFIPSSIANLADRNLAFLGLLGHEVKHLRDVLDGIVFSSPDPIIRLAKIEYSAWMEDFYFSGPYLKQMYLSAYNERKFILDNVPGPLNDFTTTFARLLGDAPEYQADPIGSYQRLVAPMNSSALILAAQTGYPINTFEYVLSPLGPSPVPLYGRTLQGFNFVFLRNSVQYNVFSDLNGEWLYYNGQWTPDTAKIAARLLNPTSIALAQYQDMVAYDQRVTAGFVRLPSTYEALINNPPNQQMINDLKAAFDQAFSLDPQDFATRLNWIQHIVINSYGNTHGSGHAYPSTGTIILNSYFYSQLTLQPDRMFFLTDLVFHESVHLQDLVGNSNPTLRQFRMSERNAYAEMAHWELLERSLTAYALSSYAMNQFLADHIPDNDYNGVVAAAVSDSISLFPEAVTPLTTLGFTPLSVSGGFFQLYAGLANLKYVSSPIATMTKGVTVLNGYAFSFQKPDQSTVSAFVDLSGQWIYYNSQWFQWTTSGTQVSISQFDASGRLALTKQYDNGVLSWTQQYYYAGANTTPDYSIRTYANGNVGFYDAAGNLICDIAALLDRTNITVADFDRLKASNPPLQQVDYFPAGMTYVQFRGETISAQDKEALKRLLTLAIATNPARFKQIMQYAGKIVIKPYTPITLVPGWEFNSAAVVLDNALYLYYNSADLSESGLKATLPLVMRELAHFYDAALHISNPAYWPASAEEYENQEQVNWMRALGFPNTSVNRDQWITDRISDNNYTGLAAQYITGNITSIKPGTTPPRPYTYDEAYSAIMAPFEAASRYLIQIVPGATANTITFQHGGSTIPSPPLTLSGNPVQGYQITLSYNGNSYQIFADLTGQWIYYNGVWYQLQGGIFVPAPAMRSLTKITTTASKTTTQTTSVSTSTAKAASKILSASRKITTRNVFAS